MTYLQGSDVQTWLEQTKLTVDSIEVGLEQFISSSVLGTVATRYDTSLWVDRASTPPLIRSTLAMLYAAAYYRRQYSEDLTENPAWPVWLETTANLMITQITSGVVDLPASEVDSSDTTLSEPIFFPTDVSSDPEIGNDPAAFTMSKVF